jgi:hypothetical protein
MGAPRQRREEVASIVRCVAGEQWEAPSSSSVGQGSQEGATAVQPEAEVEE